MLRLPQHLRIYQREFHGEYGDSGNFVLDITSRGLRVLASNGEGWDHVSVSTATRCPTWEEMEWLKRQLFNDEDCVMQLHVPVSQHKNCHPFCLHMWRPHNDKIPQPPSFMVAP